MFRGDAEGEPSSQSAGLVAEAVKDTTPMTPSALTSGAADSLLPIVQSQRERFRIRAQELEGQNISMQQQLQLFQNETDKLRSDNVKLYEKIKFLQGYPGRGSRAAGDDGVESKYHSTYEEKLDPFSSFSKKERQRKYMNLKPHDKITLNMGRFILGNKLARTFVFFYTLILHCLVFLVLYKLAFTESCKRTMSADCHQRFAEHMMKVHGDNHFHG